MQLSEKMFSVFQVDLGSAHSSSFVLTDSWAQADGDTVVIAPNIDTKAGWKLADVAAFSDAACQTYAPGAEFHFAGETKTLQFETTSFSNQQRVLVPFRTKDCHHCSADQSTRPVLVVTAPGTILCVRIVPEVCPFCVQNVIAFRGTGVSWNPDELSAVFSGHTDPFGQAKSATNLWTTWGAHTKACHNAASDAAITQTFSFGCGTDNHQVFGEKWMATDGSVYQNTHANPVASSCHCQSIAQQDNALAYKYFGERKVCILHRTSFSDTAGDLSTKTHRSTDVIGKGWWGAISTVTEGMAAQNVAAGWLAGTPRFWARHFVTTVNGQEADVTAGAKFDLTVRGYLAYHADAERNLANRQRIRITQGNSCQAGNHPTVSGLFSSKVVASPKPTGKPTAHSATWTGLRIAATKFAAEYHICWCALDCFEPSSWQMVHGSIKMPGSSYSWVVSEDVALNKEQPAVTRETAATPGGLGSKLTLSRPSFTSTVHPSTWGLKLVLAADAAMGGCSHMAASTGVGVKALDLAAGDARQHPGDAFSWQLEIESTVKEGAYAVCLNYGEGFERVCARTGQNCDLQINALARDKITSRKPFDSQSASAEIGATRSVSVTGSGMFNSAGHRFAMSASKCDGTANTAGATFAVRSRWIGCWLRWFGSWFVKFVAMVLGRGEGHEG